MFYLLHITFFHFTKLLVYLYLTQTIQSLPTFGLIQLYFSFVYTVDMALLNNLSRILNFTLMFENIA